jgi:hypothetical protein
MIGVSIARLIKLRMMRRVGYVARMVKLLTVLIILIGNLQEGLWA